MEFIPNDPILKFNPDTLQAVRKLYNLDQPGRMEQAINILDEWVKKQEHFIKKDFSKEFLERLIIANKGLLERTKLRLDKTCTLRTLLPQYFEYTRNLQEEFEELRVIPAAMLPKLTPENYRILFSRNTGKKLSNTFFLNLHRVQICAWEYLLRHDYNAGCIIVFDNSNANLMELIQRLDVNESRQFYNLFLEGYGARIIGIHIITTSKLADILISVMKQIFTAKIANRIYVHANMEAVYNIVPKDLLPGDYGGKEKQLLEIHYDWINILSTDEHTEYRKTINEAKTDESRRTIEKFNEHYLGTPGTFRNMIVD